MDDREIFNLVRENYASANSDYIAEQVRIASQNLPNTEKKSDKTDTE